LVTFESLCVPTVADAKRVKESCRAIAQITHKSVVIRAKKQKSISKKVMRSCDEYI
jgi:hypothetical protein